MRSFRENLADLLGALPDAVDAIAGYSLGGRFALGLIAAAPQRFRRATIISAHPGLTDRDERAGRDRADRLWIERLRRDGIEAFVRAWESQPLFASQAACPAPRLERQRMQRLGQSPDALARSLEHHGLAAMPDLWDAATRFPGDLTWVAGALDRRFSAIAREVHRRKPSTRLRLLEGVGHNPLLECPDILAGILLSDTATEVDRTAGAAPA